MSSTTDSHELRPGTATPRRPPHPGPRGDAGTPHERRDAGQHGRPADPPRPDPILAMSEEQLRDEVVNLRRAVASNRRIGAAVGVVMHERGLGYDEAFAVLRKTSQDSNVPLSEVAATVLHLGRSWS